MGETQNQPIQLSFNSSLKVDFQGSRVTSDGGLVLLQVRAQNIRPGQPWSAFALKHRFACKVSLQHFKRAAQYQAAGR